MVERNLCDSRQQAQRLIRAGDVRVDQRVIDKPGTEISRESTIQVKARSPFVSRGGEKLAKALQEFPLSVQKRICVDGGISTGGFTDCLLQHGAHKVYGVDVGYGQVAWSLRQDPRVILKERTNLRYLTPEELYGTEPPDADLGVVDVSFISLTKVLPALWRLLVPPRDVIALIKPQFEVGKDKVGKKGVVRESNDHVGAIAQVITASQKLGWHVLGLTWSPLVGPAGNIEYLIWLSVQSADTLPHPTDHAPIDVNQNALMAIAEQAKQALER